MILKFARSPLFFLFILQTVQFTTCLLFSIADVYLQRIKLKLLLKDAIVSSLGFVPFVIVWKMNIIPFERDLPSTFPTIPVAIYQFGISLLFSDLFHYLAHRVLHSNKFLKSNIHSVHHAYEGPIYSWVGSHAHPIEVIINIIVIYAPFVCFAHVYILWSFAIIATINSVCIHSGYHSFGLYRLFPSFILNPNHHESHHAKNATKNYGNLLQIWDRQFSTFQDSHL